MAGVEVTTDGGVATVTIDNAAKRNAITPGLADELKARMEQINADESVGALVVTGAGDTFCSGADLSSLSAAMADPSGEEAVRSIDRIYHAFIAVGTCAVPVVAAIRGAAVGAGVNLAMAADLRVIAHDARLISGFARLGLHPGGGHSALVDQSSSRQVAAAMSVFALPVNGDDAVRHGLAWEAVAAGDVLGRALEIAAPAGRDPALARRTVASMRATTGANRIPWLTAVQVERAHQMWSQRRAHDGGAPA